MHSQGLGAAGGIHVSLTHRHLPPCPSTEKSWDGKVTPALEEHSQNKVSSLSSTGFWNFLATNTVPTQAAGFRWSEMGGEVCQHRAPASSDEEWEQEEAAPWRDKNL